MKKKKILIIGIIVVIILIIFGIITSSIDKNRVAENHEPKFCIKIVNNDGSKVTYWGLGYKVIRYISTSENEPYENNIGTKFGSWFMKYELETNDEEDNQDIDIKELDDFYNTELTKDNDIRKLSKEYNISDAKEDNCFVIGAAKVYNDNLYSEFMEDYKNNISSFIRVVQTTIEGDIIIYDILYDQDTDKLYLVIDNTRDEYSSDEDKNIELTEFESTSEYKYNNYTYWILYNEEINDNNFNSDDVFIITKIN